jgi:RHS repeat-associated protein
MKAVALKGEGGLTMAGRSKFMRWLGRVLAVCSLMCVGIANVAAETVTYYHNDVSGTPLVATDATGKLLWKETYRPYGERIDKPLLSGSNPIGYAGKAHDAQLGLSYFGARYYDPVLGRFLSVDPASADIGNVHGLNRYAYANNNPYRYVDPDGHTPLDVAFLVWDIGKLGVAIYTGVGVGAAVTDVAISVVGVGSPIPGLGQAIKAAKAAEHAAQVGRAADRAVDAATVTKGVPNPFGKAGGPAHQAKVEEVAAGVKARGLEASTEHRVLTPDACKSCRYVDVVGKNAEGKVVEMHQVGRQTRAGNPVAREVRALDDIETVTKTRPKFHPYN